MRTLKISISTAAIAIAMLSVVSCKKEFYTKANVNPNSPNAVPDAVLLSGAEVAMGYVQGGDMSRFASMFVQQTTGVSRQAAAYYSYVFTNQDPETMWDNLYDDVMENDMVLMKQAAKEGNHAYYGAAQIMMAYSLQLMVDEWGSIPYSQALQGGAQLYPSYDNDKGLYDTIMNLCSRGIANLDPTLDANDHNSPGSDDVIYGGNGANWVKFAHAIKARLYIHQSYIKSTSTNVVAMADSALAEAGRSFGSYADDAQVMFGASATNNNPWYQFNTQRGDIEFAYTNYTPGNYGTFSDSLVKEADPRYSMLIDSAGEATGADAGLGTFYGGPTGVVEFSTYAEMQFVSAEAVLRGAVGVAQTYYMNGLMANMTKLGVSSGAQTTFMAGPWGTLSVVPATALIQNAWEENIALYLNPEAWTLWRRCNWNITPTNGSSGVPRRLLYPQSEIGLNTSASATAAAATQWSPKVFWDK